MRHLSLRRCWLSSCIVLVLAALSAVGQEKPADSKPLPDLVELLGRLRANQANVEKARKDYVCVLNQTWIHTNNEGKEKYRVIEQYEIFYVEGRRVSRQIGRDGKPLTQAEKQQEEKEVQWRIAGIKEAGNRKDDGRAPTVLTYLNASTLRNPRRVQYRDHEVILVDFQPNPEAKARSRAERLVQKFSGSVWIDESALEVVKLEALLDENMKQMGGVMGSLKEGARVVIEQQKTSDGIWLPASTEFNYSGRYLFMGQHGKLLLQYADYRKVHAL